MDKFSIFIILFLNIIFTTQEIKELNINIYNNKDKVFISQEVPENIYEKMIGKSIPLDKIRLIDKYEANDELYKIFIKHGWSWGGNWKYKKDYQHFEKN